MANNTTNVSDFYCTQCGSRGLPVVRTSRKVREPGHLKKLYCPKCHVQNNMVEVRPFGAYDYSDFYLEFKYHNFNSEGQRVEPNWKIFISNILDKMSQEDYEDFQHDIEKHKSGGGFINQ